MREEHVAGLGKNMAFAIAEREGLYPLSYSSLRTRKDRTKSIDYVKKILKGYKEYNEVVFPFKHSCLSGNGLFTEQAEIKSCKLSVTPRQPKQLDTYVILNSKNNTIEVRYEPNGKPIYKYKMKNPKEFYAAWKERFENEKTVESRYRNQGFEIENGKVIRFISPKFEEGNLNIIPTGGKVIIKSRTGRI